MNTENTLTDTIEENQLCWYGRMKRMEEKRLPKMCYE